MAEINHTEHDLDSRQKRDAKRREAPSAAVVYEAIRREAESELTRPLAGLWFSALAAGLSMGFSLVSQAALYSYVPDADWKPIVTKLGYAVGFLFVILGRQQLFTENTITPILELLRVRRLSTVRRTLNLWLVVLFGNLAGTTIFALMLSNFDVLQPKFDSALASIAASEYEHEFFTMFIRAIFAGWLIALMCWLLPFAETARVAVIVIVTYIIGLAQFPHIIAGSVAALYGVFMGDYTVLDFLWVFFTPTILGNIVGGVALVAAINYAQVAYSDATRDNSSPDD